MRENHDSPILWYFADPMCSWCWGFSPVITKIKENYASDVKIALVMGGLQAGESNPISVASREEILHHWHQVKDMTGQTFTFDNAIPKGFIYNTEPACRAVVTVAQMDRTKTFEYFTSIQSAFYTQNLDVTKIECLQQLAIESGLNGAEFAVLFNDDKQVSNTAKNFQFSRKAGVQGFPTLILNMNEKLHVITRGYQNYETVSSSLNQLLEKS